MKKEVVTSEFQIPFVSMREKHNNGSVEILLRKFEAPLAPSLPP